MRRWPICAARLIGAALLSAAVMALSSAVAVAAPLLQDVPPTATPTPPPAAGPDLGGALQDFGNQLLGQLGGIIQQALSDWFARSGPGFFGKMIAGGFGLLAEFLWNVAGGLFGGANIFTQLPPAWSYQLAPVVQLRDKVGPLAQAALAAALVLGIAWAGIGTVLGRPFGRLLNAVPTFLLATGGLLFAPQLMRWWIDFANAASAALLDPGTGLPGLGNVQGFDRLSALGVVAVVYLVIACLLLLLRIKLVVLAALLLIVAPLAIAAGALPFAAAQRFFGWWLATFLAVTFVQVLQAGCLGLGAALLASPAITGQYQGPAQGMMSAGIGVGALVAAMSLPSMLLGSLARANLAPGALSTALQVGAMVSGIGLARAVPAAAGAAVARPWATPPVGVPVGAGMAAIQPAMMGGSGGYVRSLLGESVPLLPPPRP